MNRKTIELLHKLGLCTLKEKEELCRKMTDAYQRASLLDAMLQVANRRICDLSKTPEELLREFADILALPDKTLEDQSQFTVQKTEDDSRWETVTARCYLGGCDMNCYAFHTKRDALLFSALLKAIGYKPPRDTACHDCYSEYIKEHI